MSASKEPLVLTVEGLGVEEGGLFAGVDARAGGEGVGEAADAWRIGTLSAGGDAAQPERARPRRIPRADIRLQRIPRMALMESRSRFRADDALSGRAKSCCRDRAGCSPVGVGDVLVMGGSL